MPKSEKGNNSVKCSKNFMKIYCNQVIYIIYPNCMPDIMICPIILFTQLLYYIKCQNWKRDIIQPVIYRILPKANHMIYTLYTICMANIMILAQGVLQIFCSQGPLWVKCHSLKRGIIQSNIDRIL